MKDLVDWILTHPFILVAAVGLLGSWVVRIRMGMKKEGEALLAVALAAAIAAPFLPLP